MAARRCVLAMAMLAVSCGSEKPSSRPPERAALGGEIVARVGSETISVSLVEKVAAEQKIAPRDALQRLLDDAIAANAAREKKLDQSPPGSWNLEAARARVVAEKVLADARAKGPPTDDEIRELSAEFWREVDRPPSLRVSHALAMRSDKGDAAFDAKARAVAEQLLAAAKTATSSADFIAKTKAVPHPKEIKVVVEALGGFIADGRTTEGDPGRSMDKAFAKGAFAIPEGETTSGVVESKFGWHVIWIDERVPEQRMPMDTRRVAFTAPAHAARAKRAIDEALASQRASHPVTILPSAEQLMREAAKP